MDGEPLTENLLSEELIAELGEDCLVTNRHKKAKLEEVAPEFLEAASKLSKQAKKRFQQIELRKEKDSKRSEYLETLQKNEISENHRELMLSTRDIGQTHSYKALLKRIFRKHKAGMSLTAEETALLFPNKDGELDAAKASFESVVVNEQLVLPQVSIVEQSDKDKEDVAVDINDLMGFAVPVKVGGQKPNKKGKKAAISITDEEAATVVTTTATTATTTVTAATTTTAAAVAAPSAGAVGGNWMSQLAHMKSTIPAANKSSNSFNTDSSNGNNSSDVDSSVAKVYVPNAISLPEMSGKQMASTGPTVGAKGAKAGGADELSRKVIQVIRNTDIQVARMSLPVCGMEQEIVEAINYNDVVILCGETGSGKSTQTPQFLYEAGYAAGGLICITQPRRVAATSTAARVACELSGLPSLSSSASSSKEPSGKESDVINSNRNSSDDANGSIDNSSSNSKKPTRLAERRGRKRKNGLYNLKSEERIETSLDNNKDTNQDNNNNNSVSIDGVDGTNSWNSSLVGYQVRFDSSTITKDTKIVFMTDGILLREITTDLLLSKYSVILLDEAHERNVNTDILLGMLSKAIPLRRSLADQQRSKWLSLSPEERAEFQTPMQPLKLVIMSATLRIEDFKNPKLFPVTPPVINVDARQYPVVTHFSKRTETVNYLDETFKKVCQIHRKLPEGGVLVFLTGKREILHMCRKLSRYLNKIEGGAISGDNSAVDGGVPTADGGNDDNEVDNGWGDAEERMDMDDDEVDHEEKDDVEILEAFEADVVNYGERVTEEHFKLEDSSEPTAEDSSEMDVEDDDVRSRMLSEALGFATNSVKKKDSADPETGVSTSEDPAEFVPKPMKATVLPLFAMMSPQQQAKVFAAQPPGRRLIVVATNVAETSITIPGIRYVVDCGRQKELIRDLKSGISKFEINWVSKTSAEQRKGRAGRTGPGHCYRLYSSAFFDQHMPLYQQPAILVTPLEDLLLQMKAMKIPNVDDFPFPTSPPATSLRIAQTLLVQLGAVKIDIHSKNSNILENLEKCKELIASSDLSHNKSNSDKMQSVRDMLLLQSRVGEITELGMLMSKLPVNPRFSKILIVALRSSTLSSSNPTRIFQLALSLVAVLAERSPFLVAGSSKRASTVASSEYLPIEEDDEEDDLLESKESDLSSQLWWHPAGDALARVRATGAYAHTAANSHKPHSVKGEADDVLVKFCKSQNIHQQTVERSLDLKEQLQKIVVEKSHFELFHQVEIPVSSNKQSRWSRMDPPTTTEEQIMRQLVLSGYSDCIARRAPLGTVKEGSRRKRFTAYLSCNPSIGEPLYLHPHSSLFQRDPSADLPEFVVYTSLMKSARGDCSYMVCVTPITWTWISSIVSDSPLLQWSPPLASPSPVFDLSSDSVVCYSIPKYGVHGWELPPVKRSLVELSETNFSLLIESAPIGFRKKDEGYRWFARLLLEGSVLVQKSIKRFLRSDLLKEKPSVITDLKPSAAVSSLLRALITANVHSKHALLTQLKINPGFLMPELEAFLHTSSRKDFRQTWLTMQ